MNTEQETPMNTQIKCPILHMKQSIRLPNATHQSSKEKFDEKSEQLIDTEQRW